MPQVRWNVVSRFSLCPSNDVQTRANPMIPLITNDRTDNIAWRAFGNLSCHEANGFLLFAAFAARGAKNTAVAVDRQRQGGFVFGAPCGSHDTAANDEIITCHFDRTLWRQFYHFWSHLRSPSLAFVTDFMQLTFASYLQPCSRQRCPQISHGFFKVSSLRWVFCTCIYFNVMIPLLIKRLENIGT